MELLPARAQKVLDTADSWRVTVAQHQYSMVYVYYYAGILQWDLRHTSQGEEYGAYSWGILIHSGEEK